MPLLIFHYVLCTKNVVYLEALHVRLTSVAQLSVINITDIRSAFNKTLASERFRRNAVDGTPLQRSPPLVGLQRERRWQKRADYASGCCSYASFEDGFTLWYIAQQPHSTLFSYLCYVAFRPQPVDRISP